MRMALIVTTLLIFATPAMAAFHNLETRNATLQQIAVITVQAERDGMLNAEQVAQVNDGIVELRKNVGAPNDCDFAVLAAIRGIFTDAGLETTQVADAQQTVAQMLEWLDKAYAHVQSDAHATWE